MKPTLVDTDILSMYFRGHERVGERMERYIERVTAASSTFDQEPSPLPPGEGQGEGNPLQTSDHP